MTSLFGWGFATPAEGKNAKEPSPGKPRSHFKPTVASERPAFRPSGPVGARRRAMELRNPRSNNVFVVSFPPSNLSKECFLRSSDCKGRSDHPGGCSGTSAGKDSRQDPGDIKQDCSLEIKFTKDFFKRRGASVWTI